MMADENGRRYWTSETIGQPVSKHHDAPAIPRARAHVRAREGAARKAIEAAEAAQEALEAAEAAREALDAAVRAEQLPHEDTPREELTVGAADRAERLPQEDAPREETATAEGLQGSATMKPQEADLTERTAARASATDSGQTGLPVGESHADWSRQSKPAARFLRRICSASKWTGVNSKEFTQYLIREAEKVDWNDPERPTPGMHTQMSRILARAVVDELEQQADVSWKEFLQNNPEGKNRERALIALDKERKSLLKSILTN